MPTWMCTFLWTCIYFVILYTASAEKFRLCVVDGKGKFKASQTYCPKLDNDDSKVECVVALDRLDCLRRISKGSVDFSVFTPEDLVTSENVGVEILLTNEIRYTKSPQDYQVVAVIDNHSGIKSRHDLKDKRYCHPGYGYEADWTTILSNFFEASVSTPSCDEKLTLTENRIKATGDFFRLACKAGPWVHNPQDDYALKKKYPHLCELCDSSYSCSQNDKYWGRKGSLLCLTDGSGDVTWARLDDVNQHFGLTPGGKESSPENYSFLCPDDTIMPVNSTKPCIWVQKPWPVVGARRVVAQEIQELVSSLRHEDRDNWRYNLRYLLDKSYADFVMTDSIEPIEAYLDRATGFLSANSFSGCHPPRMIKICTTSTKESAKCNWLKETAAVYGIEPSLECIKADNTTHCMKAVELGVADVTMVQPDQVHEAVSKFGLKTLFYETVHDNNKYKTMAFVKPGSSITSWEDMRGKKACFPVYDGVAWNTVKHYLGNQSLIGNTCDREMSLFFGPSCTPNMPKDLPRHMAESCQGDSFNGEEGALQCLTSGVGDVAFVSANSVPKFILDRRISAKSFQMLCLTSPKTSCHLSWDAIGRGMVRGNVTDLWAKEAIDVFMYLSDLFGKQYKASTTPFTLFGKFDGTSNLLFHDATVSLRNVPTVKDIDTFPRNYDLLLKTDHKCIGFNNGYVSQRVFNVFLVASIILARLL